MSSRHGAQPETLIGAIWAQANDGIIGAGGTMPWHVPEDLAHFKRVTAGHPVIMGRNTWASFPEKFRPLPNRSNIVVTSKDHEQLRSEGALAVASVEQAISLAKECPGAEEIWIIGGGKLYAATLDLLDLAVITRLNLSAEGDTRAPELTQDFSRSSVDPAQLWHRSKSGIEYRFESWIREKD